MNTQTKKGRKHRGYIASWGGIVPGLRRRPFDGKWEIVSTKQIFSQPDERRAVEKFKELTGLAKSIIEQQADEHQKNNSSWFNSKVDWRWIGEQIRKRPIWVAEKTGIEQIGYLTTLQKPIPLNQVGTTLAKFSPHACLTIAIAPSLLPVRRTRFQEDIHGQCLRDVPRGERLCRNLLKELGLYADRFELFYTPRNQDERGEWKNHQCDKHRAFDGDIHSFGLCHCCESDHHKDEREYERPDVAFAVFACEIPHFVVEIGKPLASNCKEIHERKAAAISKSQNNRRIQSITFDTIVFPMNCAIEKDCLANRAVCQN